LSMPSVNTSLKTWPLKAGESIEVLEEWKNGRMEV